jgi:uncharacterized protein YbjQ (UPF0145 family)
MIAVTTVARIDGYRIVAYKGTAQGETFEELLTSAEYLGANAILNTCYDDALDVDTLFHGAAVVIEPIPVSLQHLAGGTPVYSAGEPTDLNQEAL